MGYNPCRSYFSPKQMAYMHQRFITSEQRRGYFTCDSHPFNTDIEIVENAVWLSEKVSDGNITIKAGKTLTIKCKLYMKPTKKIIIEQGAKLVVDGGNITNYCEGGLWQGIEVWGNTNLPHTDANQGVLEVKNGAIIEDAINAVTTWKPNDWAKSGGIIRASNSTFRNNRRSVEFRYYPNYTNTSYFDKCKFENTRRLNSGYMGTDYMVTMENVKKQNFSLTKSTA